MNQFLSQLLGTISASDYLAGFVFALIGAVISLRQSAKKRNKFSGDTPIKFSWWFLIHDNAERLFNGFLITFLCFRFAPILNQEFSMLYAVGIGACNDQAAGLISKISRLARK